MTRDQMIELVQKIMNCEMTEEETSIALEKIERSVPYSGVSDLIFWHKPELTAEQVIDKALAYKPIRLPDTPLGK